MGVPGIEVFKFKVYKSQIPKSKAADVVWMKSW
jgi:hypothetical protein